MTTAHDDPARTWRDLTDQLAPEQIARLQRMEAQAPTDWPPGEVTATLLGGAREYAEQNLTDAMFDTPAPADATNCYHWEQVEETGVWSREFTGARWDLDGIDIEISGRQYSDGGATRTVMVCSDNETLSADHSRRAAAALLNAADEIERLAR